MGFSYNVNVLNQKGSPALYTDTFANRPAFGYAGRLFIANDTSAIYEDTGTAWVLIANVSSGAGTLQQVTTNGNTSNVGISVTAGGVSTNSATITSLTTGSVPFAGAGGLISQDNANLFWDDTNNRLGINTNTPGNSLDVHTSASNPTIAINNTAALQSAISFLNTSVAKWRIGNTAINSFDIYNFTLAAYAMTINNASNAVEMSGTLNANEFNLQPNGYSLLASLSRNLTGSGYGVLSLRNSANGTIQPSSLTVDRTYTLPDATGTIALTSNLASYLPLAGGTLSGRLNGIVGGILYNTAGLWLQGSNSTDGIAIGGTSGSLKTIDTYGGPLALNGTAGNAVLINTLTDDTVNKLQVTGSAKITGDINLPYGSIINWNSSSNQYIYADVNFLYIGTANFSRITISTSGVLLVANLAGTGSRAVLADASGNLSAPVSDETVKENVQSLKYGLDAIMQLNPISFEYIDEYKNYGEGLQIGNIAQDVEKVIPEAVFTTPSTGLKGINYNQFDGIYIKAIQDLNNIIETQNTLIQSLISRIEFLENKV